MSVASVCPVSIHLSCSYNTATMHHHHTRSTPAGDRLSDQAPLFIGKTTRLSNRNLRNCVLGRRPILSRFSNAAAVGTVESVGVLGILYTWRMSRASKLHLVHISRCNEKSKFDSSCLHRRQDLYPLSHLSHRSCPDSPSLTINANHHGMTAMITTPLPYRMILFNSKEDSLPIRMFLDRWVWAFRRGTMTLVRRQKGEEKLGVV